MDTDISKEDVAFFNVCLHGVGTCKTTKCQVLCTTEFSSFLVHKLCIQLWDLRFLLLLYLCSLDCMCPYTFMSSSYCYSQEPFSSFAYIMYVRFIDGQTSLLNFVVLYYCWVFWSYCLSLDDQSFFNEMLYECGK